MIMLLHVKVSISGKVKSLRGSLSRGMATHLMWTCLEDGLTVAAPVLSICLGINSRGVSFPGPIPLICHVNIGHSINL